MKISEIFQSIDGEGITAGFPAMFIRTFGCNLRCTYCDSMYAVEGKDYKEMSVDEIVSAVLAKNKFCTRVTLTGGEPLLYPEALELIVRLLDNYTTSIRTVNVETNGAVDLKPLYEKLPSRVLKNVIVTMDWKSLTSGMSDKMLESNLHLLRNQDVLKFVVGSSADLHQMKSVIYDMNVAGIFPDNVFVSPVFGNIEPKEIVDYLLKNNLWWIRMQLQMHKFIWPPEMRGV